MYSRLTIGYYFGLILEKKNDEQEDYFRNDIKITNQFNLSRKNLNVLLNELLQLKNVKRG